MTTEDRVQDWATDYDIFDPSYIREPYPVWEKLRGECPVAHSDRWGASWMPTKYADLFAIAQDFGRFSSRDIGVGSPGSAFVGQLPPAARRGALGDEQAVGLSGSPALQQHADRARYGVEPAQRAQHHRAVRTPFVGNLRRRK